MSDSQHSLNIPGLIAFALFSFIAIRWYFSAPSSAPMAAGRNAAPRINPTQVDQLLQMFPQLSRREIMWDLQRNGGNVAATTERILSGRGLDQPPVSFQPQHPTSSANTQQPGTARPNDSAPSAPIDLISRYNLASKLNVPHAPEAETKDPKQAWAASKTERQAILQKRREEMILAARRKMEAKEKAKSIES